jgi:hypothetical protein
MGGQFRYGGSPAPDPGGRFLLHIEIRRKPSTAHNYSVHLEHICKVLGDDLRLSSRRSPRVGSRG